MIKKTPLDFAPRFSFNELTDSKNHPALVHDNRVYALGYIDNGYALSWLLQTIQNVVFNGAVMDTSSGCRSIALNTAVGGSDKIIKGERVLSSHCRFCAWDGKLRIFAVQIAFEMILEAFKKGLLPTLGKCILEKVGRKTWLHIQVKTDSKQAVLFLVTTNGLDYQTIHKG